jgi:thermitase
MMHWAAFLLLLLTLGTLSGYGQMVRLLVKPKPNLVGTAWRTPFNSKVAAKTLPGLPLQVIQVPEEQAEVLLSQLRHDPSVEYVERDGVARAAFVPADTTLTGTEWHLAKIQAPQAWTVTAGRTNTIVAVLDSGIDAAHPDLANRVLPGFNFVSGDTDTADDFGHGTAVAGVVVAAGNNNLGILGVSRGCLVMPVKVVDATGYAYYSAVAQGIHYAVDNGARVINISIAGNDASLTLQEAVDYAGTNNVLVVAAAGNNGNNLPQYPAACSGVLAVSATETNDTLAPFSSFGSFIALAAPGDNIWTTQASASNPYGAWRGTSFSSPIVAGTAALALSVNPLLSNTQLVALLEQNADDVGAPGFDQSFGYGRVNAARAVTAAAAVRSKPPAPPQFVQVTVGWGAVPGCSYQVQSLTPGTNGWTALPPDVTATSGQATKTDASAVSAPRLYRVLLVP